MLSSFPDLCPKNLKKIPNKNKDNLETKPTDSLKKEEVFRKEIKLTLKENQNRTL